MDSRPKSLEGCSTQHVDELLNRKDCFLCGALEACIVWPFVTRLCKDCLKKETQTETSLLFSDVPSLVVSSIPFAFVDSSYNFVPFTALSNGSITAEAVSKIFYTGKIKDVQQKLERARNTGASSVETFLESVKAEKAQRLKDCEAWELWTAESQTHSPNSQASQSVTADSASPNDQQLWSDARPTNTRLLGNASSRPAASDSNIHKTADAINAVKAARRAEIERRCQTLEPPISPRLLPQMDSFQAAMQIGNELTDSAWDVLKPRLLAQKPAAEEAERERLAHEDFLRRKANEDQPHEASLKEVREAADREWEESQRLIRKHLCQYADEVIQNMWAGGADVDKDSSPTFAADVLLYVRKRYFSDQQREESQIAKLCESGDLPRNLILDNMKFVYDTKVRPIAEEHRKDLFYCNGCESHPKAYGFEGVIQHYAAKHTSTFSDGNVVVHWHKAEWPDHPPFVPDPTNIKPGAQHANSAAQRTHTPYQYPSYRPYQPPPPPPPGVAYGSPAYPPSGGFGANAVAGMYPGPTLGGFVNPASPFQGFNPFPTPMSYTPVSPTGWAVPPRPVYSPPLGPHPVSFNPGVDPSVGGYPAPQSGHNFQQSQMEEVAKIGREIWFATSGIKDIPPSVRVHAVIHHVVRQFRDRFSNEPNLDLFTDCLSSHPYLAPLKNIQGLACKTCVLYNEDLEDPQTSSPFKMGDRKLYPFHSLLLHFKRVHVERKLSTASRRGKSPEDERLDWKEDMVELPEPQFIESLVHAEGMDANKFGVLAEAFPSQFYGHFEERIAKIEQAPRDGDRVSGPPSRISSHQSHQSALSHRDVGRMKIEHDVRSDSIRIANSVEARAARRMADAVQVPSPRPQHVQGYQDDQSLRGSQGTPSPASVSDRYNQPVAKRDSEAERFLSNFVPGEETSAKAPRKRPSDSEFESEPIRRRSNPPFTAESPRSLGKRKSRDIEMSVDESPVYMTDDAMRHATGNEGFKRPRSQVYRDQTYSAGGHYWGDPYSYPSQPYVQGPRGRFAFDSAGEQYVLIPRRGDVPHTVAPHVYPTERTQYAAFIERTATRRPEEGDRPPGKPRY